MGKESTGGNSGKLFDNIRRKYKLGNDGELADFIAAHRSEISEIRHNKREISDQLLVRICRCTGMTMKSALAQIEDRS